MRPDAEVCRAWVREAAARVAADRDRLTQLDSAIGDGDHGHNLDRGMRAALQAVEDLGETATAGEVLAAAGKALIAKTGGASGPLYGGALRAMGRSLDESGDLAAALRAGCDAVRKLGGAAVGDKTMVDALEPAVKAYEETCDLEVTADAATTGAESTMTLRARKGRASYLGERSVGHLDPGAASTALLIRALVTAARDVRA
ncbi:dihydroxyacetone kinase subunit L [Bailinhaonella thermotolerans]|uniref:Dihydroxyacetone kinase subunit L n=1 Tax=Bailinhaonella thermotolerans TaxID=1070861 RepID=A0A3A4AZU0_9ACTN|nr:dihydroxyacetone kinase subunit L [Bailinhaonella thermotolerans]